MLVEFASDPSRDRQSDQGGSFVPKVSPLGETQGEAAGFSLENRGHRLLTRAALFRVDQ